MAACTPSTLWAARLVRDHDVAGLQGRHEDLFDVGEETGPVHRAIEDPRGGEPGHPQGGDEGAALPPALGGVIGDPLAARAAPIPPEEIGAPPALIKKDEAGRVEGRGRRRPLRAGGRDVGAIVFGGADRFFLRVKPSCCTARQIVARLADVASATCSSARVRSGCSWISAASVCNWGASTGCRPYRCWRGATSPVSRRRCLSRRTPGGTDVVFDRAGGRFHAGIALAEDAFAKIHRISAH